MNALGSLLVLLLFTSTAGAVPFWGDKASRDAGTDPQRLMIDDPATPLGTHAYAAADGGGPDRWIGVSLPGHGSDAGQRLDPNALKRVHVAPEFMALVQPLLAPGASLVVTDLPVLEQETTGRALTVVTADPPTPG